MTTQKLTMTIRKKKRIPAKKSAEAAVASTHASGKGQRRARLIRAARDLIAERADGNFSMVELAMRAGLSPATPYNLLGSKAAILGEVYRAETEGFRRTDKLPHRKPPVERVMATVEHILRVFTHNPNFYRNLWRTLRTIGPDEMRKLIVPLSDKMLQPLVEELVAAGAIAKKWLRERYGVEVRGHLAQIGPNEISVEPAPTAVDLEVDGATLLLPPVPFLGLSVSRCLHVQILGRAGQTGILPAIRKQKIDRFDVLIAGGSAHTAAFMHYAGDL